jgi:hypothetical protein
MSLREAHFDLSFSKYQQLGKDLLDAGLSTKQVQEIGDAAVERDLNGEPIAPAPVELKVADSFGDEENKKILTPTEAADEMTNARQRLAEAQAAEFAELVGEAQADQAEQAAQAAQQAPTEPQPQPHQQQPTPEQIERQQLAQERQRLAVLKRAEGIEVVLRNDYDQLVAAAVQEFPSLRNGPPNPADVEQLRQADPARFQRLAQYDAALSDRQQKIATLAQQRQAHEVQQARVYEAQLAQARARQDADFEQRAARIVPNYGQQRGEIKEVALQTLQAAGLSRDDINNLWSGTSHSIDFHSAAAQEIVLKAALYDRAQARAHQIRQSNLPQVIRPGTYRSAPAGDAQSVRELTSQLANAKGRKAIEIGAQLTRAKRALNGG